MKSRRIDTLEGHRGDPTDPAVAEDQALDRDASEFHEALSELLRIYQFRDRKRICCHDISVTQCYALDELIRSGGLTLGELARGLYLDKSTTSRVANSLERKGLIARAPDPHDGRALRLEVTYRGVQLYNRIQADLLDEHKRLLADFDPEVRQATAKLIARLAREATRRFSRVDGSCCSGMD